MYVPVHKSFELAYAYGYAHGFDTTLPLCPTPSLQHNTPSIVLRLLGRLRIVSTFVDHKEFSGIHHGIPSGQEVIDIRTT